MIGIHKNDADLSIQKLKTNILDIFKMFTKKAMKKDHVFYEEKSLFNNDC